MQAQLLELVEIRKVSNGSGAAQTQVTGSTVDMQGFDGVAFTADFGTVTDGCVMTLKAAQGDDSGGSDKVDITGASTSKTASTSSNKLLGLDVLRPTAHRYVTPIVTRTAQDAVVNTIHALLYRARAVPVTQGSSFATTPKITPVP